MTSEPAAPTAPDTPELRPLSLGEVLDVAVKVVARNFKGLAILTLLILLPLALLQVVTLASAIDFTAVDGDVVTGDGSAAIGAFVVTTVLSAVGSILVTLAAFRMLAGGYLGETVPWRASLAFAGRRLHSGLWIGLLVGLATMVGFVLLVLPGIFLLVALSLAFPVLCVEDLRGTKALGRSFGLVKGRWWSTFGVLFVTFVILMVVSIVVGLLAGGLSFLVPDESVFGVLLVNQLVSTLGSLLTYPFVGAVLVVLYLDLRVRKEAFDLRLLAERLRHDDGTGPAAPQQAAVGG